MRVLLYNPGYTVDKDGQSLRITKLSSALAPRWQFDIVTTPVFFPHHRSLWTDPSQVHYEFPHLRVFLTNPGAIATLRARLHHRGRLRGPVAAAEGANEQGNLCRPSFARDVLRGVNNRYSQIFGRIGDPDWVLPAVLQGLRLLSSRSYQFIFSSASSYFITHVAASIVGSLGRLPVVVDYGDPWSPGPPARPRLFDRALEASVLRRAGRVIVTHRRAREALLSHHRFLRPDRVVVIPQGYDDSVKHEAPAREGGSFTIVYTGNLYAGVQSSLEFLKALRAASGQGVNVKFLWAGSAPPTEEVEQIRRMGLGSIVQNLGWLPHADALALQRQATMLLVIGTRSRYQIPGKTIEYIGARRPVLCLSEGSNDLAAELVTEHGLGVVVPNRAESILEVLTELHGLWRNGQLNTVYHPRNVGPFSWQALAGALEDIFFDVDREHVRAQSGRRIADGGGDDSTLGESHR